MKSIFAVLLMATPALADSPGVVEVVAKEGSDGWRFDVTVVHGDEGWDHYADGWAVFLPDGTQAGYRKLHHPHVNEQPFTRSLSGVSLPDHLEEVSVRAHDSVHGWGEAITVRLPR